MNFAIEEYPECKGMKFGAMLIGFVSVLATWWRIANERKRV